MLKKLALACIIGVSALSAYAAEGKVTYSYVSDQFNGWGKGKSEIYDVAIHVSDPILVGKKITSIRAVLNACDGIEATSIWLSKELVLESIDGVKVTVPDTYSATVAPERISLPGKDDDNFGQLSATIDNPYQLTEEGIYVGYSLTVPAVDKGESLTDKQKYPVMVSPCDNPESFYLRTSKDYLKWMNFHEYLAASAAIYVTFEGDFKEYCVGVEKMSDTYAEIDEDFTVKATLTNTGGTPVTELGYTYSIGGKTFDRIMSVDPPFEPDLRNAKILELPIEGISELGDYTLDLTVTTVNGGDNEGAVTSSSSKVKVLPFVPVHRPMLEEFTGTWCGWCVRGFYALETLNHLYGDDIVLAAYHNKDPMAMAAYPVAVPGFPYAALNRDFTGDPYYGSLNEGFGMKSEVTASMEALAGADIKVEAAWADEARNRISVKSTCRFLESKPDAGYKTGYLLINNGLSGEGRSWNQENYFASYGSQFVGTDFQEFVNMPSQIKGLIFNDVVVDISGMMGVEGSIPEDVSFNIPYDNEFAFDIASNDIIQDKDNLYVAAFIINPDGSILNSNKVKVETTGGVADAIDSDADVAAMEYYSISGVRVKLPENGMYIKVTRMSDGTIRTIKIMK